MVFKKISVIALLSVSLIGAAASSSKDIAAFSELELQNGRRELRNMIHAAVFSEPGDNTALNEIIAWRKNGNDCFFNMSDRNGVKPFFWVVNWMHKLSADALDKGADHRVRVMEALKPTIEQSDENKKVSDFMAALLKGDEQQFRDACSAFVDLSPEQQDQVREQYLIVTGGHYIEPLVMKDNVRRVVRECLSSKVTASGFEKIYAIGLLKYMLSPLYHKSVSPSLLNATLVCCALRETAAPSFVPALMRVKANPCELLDLDNGQKRSALQCLLMRLIKRPLERGHATRLLLEMLPSVPKDDQIGILLNLGRLGQDLTENDYMQHWRPWLEICVALGVDIKKLRRLVFPFVKRTISSKKEYVANKVVRNELCLSDAEKFAFACLVHEFAHVLASSLKADDVISGCLNIHALYDLPTYIFQGELVPAQQDVEFIKSNAERYRNKLTGQANELVAQMVTGLYARS